MRNDDDKNKAEIDSPLDDQTGQPNDRQNHPRSRSRRRTIATASLLLLIGGACYLVWSMFGTKGAGRIDLRVRSPRPEEKVDAGDHPAKPVAPDDVTAEAIAEARRAIGAPSPASAAVPTPQDAHKATGQTSPSVLTPPPLEVPNSHGSAQPNGVSTGTSADQSRNSLKAASGRNTEQSIRLDADPPPVKEKLPTLNAGPAKRVADLPSSQPAVQSFAHSSAPIVLPSFGSIIPVRTLGKMYTLRSGSITRLEVTRNVSGEGWTLSKGTVLIGSISGGEQDRAFVSLSGFIDPNTDRFVKLTGETLGSDGGSGLKGKLHKVSKAWSRAFSRVGSSAAQIGGAVAAGRISGQPVIMTDLGSRTVSPLTSEVDGAVLDSSTSRGFVEVPAGTVGFVMVTAIPPETKGVDALPNRSPSDFTQVAGGETTSPNTGLSDDELAELLSSADPQRIQAAMPRMTPRMRKLAESVLAESEK